MNKEKQIELLEKQLAFWKHHCAVLSKELTKEEEIANHYAQMLDATEEELNDERLKNVQAGYRKQSEGEWIAEGDMFKEYVCSVCGYSVDTPYQKTPYCPNCGAKMKGGEE